MKILKGLADVMQAYAQGMNDGYSRDPDAVVSATGGSLPTVLSDTGGKQCSSDISCGTGNLCVKAPMKSRGICMKSVNDYGVRQYQAPRSSSLGPNMDVDGQCQFTLQCPIGFDCDKKLKACVKR